MFRMFGQLGDSRRENLHLHYTLHVWAASELFSLGVLLALRAFCQTHGSSNFTVQIVTTT
jgi:hypothetical protein